MLPDLSDAVKRVPEMPVHVCIGGPTHQIYAGGRRWTFEMHPYCGPVVVHKRTGAEIKQPEERSPFWDAVTWWDRQGGRVDEHNVCIWEQPPPRKVKHLGGNHYEELPPGRESEATHEFKVNAWPKM